MPAPARLDAGTASQLIPGVRWTQGRLSGTRTDGLDAEAAAGWRRSGRAQHTTERMARMGYAVRAWTRRQPVCARARQTAVAWE